MDQAITPPIPFLEGIVSEELVPPFTGQPSVNIKSQLTITLTAEGQIMLSMNGEVNKIIGFGLLEIGRQSLEQWFKQQKESKVQPVSFMPPGGFRS